MAGRIVGFNYEALESEEREPAREQAEAIRGLLKTTVQSVVEIGTRLQQVRKAIGRDSFQAWIRAEFRFTQSVASNYMKAAAEFGKLDCLERFQPTALFDLGRKNVPDAAVDQAVSEARAGRPITRKRAHQIIAAHRSEGDPGPLAKEAIRRLRSSLTQVADHIEDFQSLPKEDLDPLVDQLVSIATQLRKRIEAPAAAAEVQFSKPSRGAKPVVAARRV
jgi:DNA-directed RNA polymerase subunit F